MKRKKIMILSLAVLLFSCGGQGTTSFQQTSTTTSITNNTSSAISNNNSSEIKLLEFENLLFEDETIVYDGNFHSLVVENVIDGAKVTYSSENSFKDVGEYEIDATISKEGYVTETLTATLSIIKADFEGISLKDVTIEYDGNPHLVTITGNLPQGSTVTYKCLEDESITNSIQEPGQYTIQATIENKNYNTLVLTCQATIKAKEEERFITYYGGKIYFQNALDKDRLYTYDSTGVTKVNNNKAQYFTRVGNYLYYRSDSLLSPSIVRIDGVSTKAVQIVSANAEYIISDGTNLYYAINSLLGKNNGIYRLSIENDVVVTKRIYDGKAYYLQCLGDKIYFADGKNSKKLSSITKDSETIQSPTLVIDEKINNLVAGNGVLYFTINNLTGDYIAKYNIANSKLTKLTSDAGEYLTLVGDDLYYVNVDLVNSTLIGKGIYKVSTLLSNDSSLPGTKVISDTEEEYELSSLYYFNGNLYFYRTFDKKLYSCDIQTGKVKDLLSDFVIPEERNLLASKGAVATYKDSIYYQNQYDDGNLYCYNTETGENIRVVSSSVDDLYIYKNYLYYRQVSYFVNKDLYRLDIENGGEPELISEDDCGELEIYNDKIYYVNYTGSNTLNSMNLDGSNNQVIYDEETYNLRIHDGKLYFIQDSGLYNHGYLYSLDLNTSDAKPIKYEDCRTSYFEFLGNKIYFRRLYGIGYTSKCLSSYDITTNEVKDIYDNDCDPTSFTIVVNEIYYFNDVIGDYSISKFNLETNKNTIVADNTYAYNLTYLNNKIYYYSYGNGGVVGDGHFYEMTLSGISTRIDIK